MEYMITTIVSGILTVVTGYILYKLKKTSDEVETYRKERENQEKARDRIVLSIARAMLIDNYEKCCRQGYYDLESREVYHQLYEDYCISGGNGVIKQIHDRMVTMPMHSNGGEN